MTLNVPILTVDTPTMNGRTYPKSVIADALCEYLARQPKTTLVFCAGDEEMLSNAAGVIGEVKVVDDKVMADITIIDTERGKYLKQYIERHGYTAVTFSAYGFGTTDNDNVITEYSITGVHALENNKS